MSSNFTSIRWWYWSCPSLQCVRIFIEHVWFPEFKRTYISRNTSQWLLPNISFAISKTRYRNLHYVQCLNIAPMEKAWFMAPNGKGIMASMEYSLITYSPNGRGMVLWNIVFQVVTVMAKEKKRCTIKDTMSIKITFMHYRNYITWTRVKLLVVFEEFYMVYIFWLLFSFHYYCQLGKSQV